MTRTLDAELAVNARARLGEGPAWDAAAGRLLWVDITGRTVHELRSGSDGYEQRSWPVPEEVGAALPRSRGGLLLAVRGGFAGLDDSGTYTSLTPVEADRPENRMNDAKTDPQGRCWAGTMTDQRGDMNDGALYRLDPDGTVRTMLDAVQLSNGMGWSPDESIFYYIDTPTGGVDAFDFDPEEGSIAGRRRLVTVDGGKPDGMTTDDVGCLWVAVINGGQVRRYTSTGELDTVVNLPVSRVTSCAFGGPGRDELFMTSARDGLDEAAFAAQPHAGGLFRCRPGVTGPPATPFAG